MGRGGFSTSRAAIAIAALLLLLAPGLISPAGADSATLAEHRLPSGRYGVATAWDGRFAFLFGGSGRLASLDEIVRYDTATGAVDVMGARLPAPLTYASAVWANGRAYVLGGLASPGGATSQILEYDPAADAVRVLPTRLPTAAYLSAVAWDGHRAWLFGGTSGSAGQMRQIAWFDPATEQAGASSATLPTGRDSSAAFWDGSRVYVMGGFNTSARLSQIVRFDPASEIATPLPRGMPGAREGAGVVWTGRVAFLVGGFTDGLIGQSDQIIAYDVAAQSFQAMSARLPNGRESLSLAWDGERMHVLGGFGGPYTQLVTGSNLDEIVVYTLEPGAPASVTATAQADGSVSVAWSAPPAGSFLDAPTAYAVYRETPGGARVLLAQLGDVRGYQDPAPPQGPVGYAVQATNRIGPGPASSLAWVVLAPPVG